MICWIGSNLLLAIGAPCVYLSGPRIARQVSHYLAWMGNRMSQLRDWAALVVAGFFVDWHQIAQCSDTCPACGIWYAKSGTQNFILRTSLIFIVK